MSLTKIDLTANGGVTMDLDDPILTDPITILRAYQGWSLTFVFTGADADPIIQIEGSNNNVNFHSVYSRVIDPEVGDVEDIRVLMTKAFTDTANGIDSVSNSKFPFQFFRVSLDPNGAIQGTATATLSLFTQ